MEGISRKVWSKLSQQKHSLGKAAQHPVQARLKILSPALGNPPYPQEIGIKADCPHCEEFSFCVQSQFSPGVICTSYPSSFHVIPSKKGVSILSSDTFEILEHSDKVFILGHPFSRLNISSSLSSPMQKASQSSSYLCGLFLNPLQLSTSFFFFYRRDQIIIGWMQYFLLLLIYIRCHVDFVHQCSVHPLFPFPSHPQEREYEKNLSKF